MGPDSYTNSNSASPFSRCLRASCALALCDSNPGAVWREAKPVLRLFSCAHRFTLYPTTAEDDSAMLVAGGMSPRKTHAVRLRLSEKRILQRLKLWASDRWQQFLVEGFTDNAA